MAKKTTPLLPFTADSLRQFGERLRLARRRRRLTARQVAERSGMAPMTLRSVEHGGSGVTIGAYLAVMQVLGIEKDIELLAKTDSLGRELQDARLVAGSDMRHKEYPRKMPELSPREQLRRMVESPSEHLKRMAESPGEPLKRMAESPGEQLRKTVDASPAMQIREAGVVPERDWIEQGGFANSETLAGLIDVPAPSLTKKKR